MNEQAEIFQSHFSNLMRNERGDKCIERKRNPQLFPCITLKVIVKESLYLSSLRDYKTLIFYYTVSSAVYVLQSM